MIKFETIEIQGFGSIIEPLIYNLGDVGINIIAGKNGSGKSTIVAALFWVLFGKSRYNTVKHIQGTLYFKREQEISYRLIGFLGEILY